jgi:hypothetical protein
VQGSDSAAESLPFRDGQFKAELYTVVLRTVADPDRPLNEARRVLKPAGHLVVIVHVHGTWRLAAGKTDSPRSDAYCSRASTSTATAERYPLDA